MRSWNYALVLAVVVCAASIAAAQTAPSVRFVGLDGKERQFTSADLAKLKRVMVKASAHGQEGTFEGWNLGDVLALAGVEFGEKLRGARLASILLVEDWPKDMIQGHDMQLERAVQVALEQLKQHPVNRATREPASPTWAPASRRRYVIADDG